MIMRNRRGNTACLPPTETVHAASRHLDFHTKNQTDINIIATVITLIPSKKRVDDVTVQTGDIHSPIGTAERLSGYVVKGRRIDSDEALSQYIAAIGHLNQANGSNFDWWATDIASKNRFASALPLLLNIVARAFSVISQAKADNDSLIFRNVPWPAIETIVDYCRANDVPYRIATPLFSKAAAELRGRWITLRDLTMETLRCLRDIVQTRRAYGPPPKLEGPVHVIKSFVYLSSFLSNGRYADPFFGPLPAFLNESFAGRRQILTVALGFEKKIDCYRLMATLKNDAVIPIECFQRPWDLLPLFFRLAWRQAIVLFPVRGSFPFQGGDLAPLLKRLLRFGGGTIPIRHYLHYYAARRIATAYDVRSATMTAESNPWERMMISGFREKRPNTFITGYQQSVVPQAAAGMFFSALELGAAPMPDRTLTVGRIPAEIIRQYGALPSEKIRPSCALRYNYLFDLKPLPRRLPNRETVLLVAMEGLAEVADMLAYVLKQSVKDNSVRYQLRTHPILGIDSILACLSKTRADLPPNVTVSAGRTVREDVVDCDAVLYWGTTVAVEAVFQGRPVIHFDRGDFLSYDPLFQLTSFKWTVRPDDDLGEIVQKLRSWPEDDYARSLDSALDYVRGYFLPINERSLAAFLPEEFER